MGEIFDNTIWPRILELKNESGLARVSQGKAECRDLWCKAGSSRASAETLHTYFEAGVRSAEWNADGGRACPQARKVFYRRLYEDGPESFTPLGKWTGGNGKPSYRERDAKLARAQLSAPAQPLEPGEIDVAARLRALADDAPFGARRIRALDPTNPAGTEAALAILEHELISEGKARLSAEDHEEIKGKLDAASASLAERLPAEEVKRQRTRLGRDLLRSHLRLPEMSLFAGTP